MPTYGAAPIRRRRVNLQSIAVLVFVISLFMYMYSSVFIRNTNVNLNVQIQQLNREISSLKIENEALSLDIRELASYENISKVAKEAGLNTTQANVISLRDGQ